MTRKMFVAYCQATSNSGPALAEFLNCPCTGNPDADSIIINYGAGQYGHRKYIINHPDRVHLNSTDKGLAMQMMKDYGVSTPTLFNRESILPNYSGQIVIARTGEHRGGNGFQFCFTYEEVLKALSSGYSHFINYIPIENEYRVHVIGNVPFLFKKKFKKETTANFHNRSRQYGWESRSFNINHTNVLDKIIHHSILSVKALGLDFGATDIGVDIDNNVYVFECNTGPSIIRDPNDVKIFGNHMLKYIEKRFKNVA